MATVSITSNEGKLNSASAVLEVSATNPEYNQPALRIKQTSILGGAASIRIDDPNPDIEFVETGLTGPDPGAGKFEIAVQADKLQINGRNAEVSPNEKGFDNIVVFQRPAAGGNIGIGFKEASQFKKSLEEDRVSSRLLMLPSPHRSIPLAVGFCMSRTGRSSIGVRMER